MKIGVFDSGVGGLSVVTAIETALPDADVVFLNDSENVPYGNKTPDVLFELVLPILRQFEAAQCEAIVIACNTVSTTLAARLRSVLTTPIVAIEPMVKTAAAQTKTGVIAVCATPTTLASQRYNWLKSTYGGNCTFIEPDCSDWSFLIEHNKMNEVRIIAEIEPVLQQNVDVIILGCTHYHWIETEIQQIARGKAQVIQPEVAVIAQLKRVLRVD
jgi:glutamate racemase